MNLGLIFILDNEKREDVKATLRLSILLMSEETLAFCLASVGRQQSGGERDNESRSGAFLIKALRRWHGLKREKLESSEEAKDDSSFKKEVPSGIFENIIGDYF